MWRFDPCTPGDSDSFSASSNSAAGKESLSFRRRFLPLPIPQQTTLKMKVSSGFFLLGTILILATNLPQAASSNRIETLRELSRRKRDGSAAACRSLPKIEGGYGKFNSTKNVYDAGEVVKMSCDAGFENFIVDTARCENGQFVPQLLRCFELDFGCLKESLQINVTNGQIEKLKDFFDTSEEVVIRCAPGYKSPILSATAKCNRNKTFTPSSISVRCERKDTGCLNDTLPAVYGDGRLNATKSYYMLDEVVMLVCGDEYESKTSRAVCTDQKLFIPTFLLCEKKGCPSSSLPAIEGEGRLNTTTKSHFEVDEVVVLTCGEGYENSNTSTAVCTAQKRFSPASLRCEKKDVPNPDNSKVKQANLWYLAVIFAILALIAAFIFFYYFYLKNNKETA